MKIRKGEYEVIIKNGHAEILNTGLPLAFASLPSTDDEINENFCMKIVKAYEESEENR